MDPLWGIWEWLREAAVSYWAFDRKDKLTIAGLLVTFAFSCLNFWRTSQTNKRTRANNRAARFEAVHGATLNESVKELSEIAREISIAAIGLQDLEAGKTFFREKIRGRVTKAEHMVVNEIFQISSSSLAKDKDAWKAVAQSAEWDAIQTKQIDVLASSQVDVLLANLEQLKRSLVAISKTINERRAAENDV